MHRRSLVAALALARALAGEPASLDGDSRIARARAHQLHASRAHRAKDLKTEIAARRDAARAGPARSGRPRLPMDGAYYVWAAAPGDASSKARQAVDFAASLFGAESERAARGLSAATTRPKAKESVRDGVGAVVQRALARKALTVAFSGHSAAAGHGNYFNESFPFVFQRLVGPAFAAAGVAVRVQNFALGGTHSRPHPTFCARETWGPDVDAIVWDYDMTEAGGADRNGAAAFALAARAAYDPAPLLVFKGGGVDDRPSVAAPYLEPHAAVLRYDHRKALAGLLSEKRLDANAGCAAQLLVERPGCYKKRFHPVGRCSSQVKWHPGWAVHQLHGVALALPWLEALQTALARPFPSTPPPKPPLPAIHGADDFLRGPLAAGLACATAYRPRSGRGVADLLDPTQRDAVLAHRSQRAAAGKEPDGCGQGPSDERGAVAIAPDLGPVAFHLPDVRRPLKLILCEPATGWHRAPNTIPLDSAQAKVSVDGQHVKLSAVARNSHLQRCFTGTAGGASPPDAVVLAVEVSGGAHQHVRLSQVIWSSG